MRHSKHKSGKSHGSQKGLSPKYQRDFDRKDSGSRPEVVRRIVIAIHNNSVAVTGNAPYSASNAGGVVNTPEFQAIAQQNIYREFRVVALRTRVCAIFQSPVSPNNNGLGPLVGAVGTVAPPPNDNTGMLSSQGFRIGHGPLPYIELKCDAGLNPNALLWSPIDAAGTATLTPLNELSTAWRFTRAADSLYNGKPVTDEWYEYDVEFRTAG